MADWKSITLLAAVAAALGGPRFVAAADGTKPVPPGLVQIDAHRPVTYHFAVTNTTDKPQTVESVRTSCACLKVADVTGLVPPGGVLPFDVEFNPAGMEGRVEKRVWVTLAPSKSTLTFNVAADVRLRLGFKPMDAAFGVIKRSETGREIVAKLSGYAAEGVKLGMPYTGRTGVSPVQEATGVSLPRSADSRGSGALAASSLKGQDARCPSRSAVNGQDVRCPSVFDVRLGEDGKSLVVKFRERNVLPGIYSEVWTIPTSDPEIPEIVFPVSARVADAVAVTPQVITVGWDEPVCSRMVTVRAGGFSHKDHKEDFVVLSAETKPRKWGDVKITQRPKNGWRIDIANIDPREVRQFSKRPFLEVKTNLPGMESFEIPLRVVNDGGAK